MEFSEANQEWRPIPQWVDFLIRVGYSWQRNGPKPRRIALISMPCDSSAAGLIALGAMVRDLTDAKANDIDGHYDKLLQYSLQFLNFCRPCNMPCHPELKRCGYPKQATGRLRSPLLHGTVTISEQTNFEERQIRWIQRDGRNNHCLVIPSQQHTLNYHIEDEPPPIWGQENGQLLPDPYRKFAEHVNIVPATLRQSYSGLCFAGRAAGGSRDICAAIQFREETTVYPLDDLLTIQGWSSSPLSRVSFFNPRTQRLDRNNAVPNLVIADGDASFLKALDYSGFHRSDIIGVIHRNVERERLEALGAKMSPNQWYEADTEKLSDLPSHPRGISVAILKERNA